MIHGHVRYSYALHTYPEDRTPIEHQWSTLLHALGPHSLYQTWEWFRHQVEGPRQAHWGRVFVLSVHTGERLIAMLPLRETTLTIGTVRLPALSLPWERAAASAVLADPQYSTDDLLGSAGHWLAAKIPAWQLVALPRLVEGSPFAGGTALDLRRRIARSGSGSTKRIAATGSMPDYLKTLSTKARAGIRNAANRLRGHQVTLVSLTQPGPDLDAGLEAFYALEAAGWKNLSSVSRIPTEMLVRALAQHGQARIDLMSIDGTPAAVALSCRPGDGVHYVYKIAYSENLAYFSPGRVLLHDMIASCFEDATVTTIDFMSDSDWLSPFDPASSSLSSVYVFRRSLRGQALLWAAALRAYHRGRLRRTPR